MQIRSQIALSSEDHRRAKKRAAELGVSLAEYIRQLVARDLHAPDAAADPSLLFDLGSSGGSDVALSKDVYLGEAAESAHAE
jgi:hypothetical protein